MEIKLKDGLDNIDFARTAEMLGRSFWSPGIKEWEVRQAAENSALVVGAFLDNGLQIAYGRVISDRTRFAYLTDIYVDEKYRRMGIGQKIVSHILQHPSLSYVYQWLLITKNAHGVYRKQGFDVVARPLDFMEIRLPRPNDRNQKFAVEK
ncbi:MAG: GNAT family N-acetyltransferase [Synergistaceae bacterium]|nr:GNAT family N-acetyltransferase [Synergistaceae bacterium]